ncbi:MAG: TetR family transcriptional regulator [Candidatus Sulfotelmatobacter sp.]|jgi:AcrR family transcriptional regulator
MQRKRRASREEILETCLATFVKAGTIDLSLDQLADRVGTSKRMLIHYFGSRENIEEGAMTILEERLRAQFAPESFPPDISAEAAVAALWEQTTAPKAKGVLLLVMDLSRRAWNGSARAQAFYAEQQRLWVQLLMKFLPDQPRVEEVLQLFQGAVLAYLITGDPEPGRRSLARMFSSGRTTDRNPNARANRLRSSIRPVRGTPAR